MDMTDRIATAMALVGSAAMLGFVCFLWSNPPASIEATLNEQKPDSIAALRAGRKLLVRRNASCLGRFGRARNLPGLSGLDPRQPVHRHRSLLVISCAVAA